MNDITDTDRLNWIIKNKADIDYDVNWVIYTQQNPLGNGDGCSRDLRKAIDKAIMKVKTP
jgi:hypothetical protein